MAKKYERYFSFWILLAFYEANLCLACTFPTDLVGTFDSTKEGSLDFNSTTYGKFSIATQSQTFTDLEYTCHINSGTKYVSKSQEFSIFSSAFYAYMCLDITPVSSNLYYYYYATQTLPQANNARVKIFPISTVVGTIADVCDEPTPYQQPYSILLKNDTIITEEMISCPEDLHGYFSYNIDDGSNGFCENQTTALDTCTNSSILSFDYNSCNDSIMHSATGQLYCLFYQQPSSGVYQITLYNGDNTIDNTNTYKYTCLMFEKGINESYATQYPTECQNSTVMNSTMVPSPGASIVFTHTGECQTLPQANNARVKIFPISTVVGTIADVCDEPTPYQQPYSILLKNDTIITEEMISCPEDLHGYFSYNIDDGSNGFCENQTTALDTCTNSSILNFDYNSCNDSIMHSATGQLYCLFYQQPSSGVYQITLYNGDNTIDNTNTYKYTCLMFEKGINESYATQYPTECQNSTVMNSTMVPSPGASIVFTHTGECPGPSTPPTSLATEPTAEAASGIAEASLTGGLIGGVIFVAVLIILIVILIKNNKKSKEEPDTERGKEKQKKSKNTSKVDPLAVPPKTKKRVDRNARPIFTPSPPRNIDDPRPTKQPSSIFDMDSEEGVAPSLEKEYTLPIYSDYGDCSDLEDGEQKSPTTTIIESKKIQQRLRDSGIVMTPAPDSTIPPDMQRAQSVMARNSRASKMGSLNSSTTGPPTEPVQGLPTEPVQGPQYNPVKDTAV